MLEKRYQVETVYSAFEQFSLIARSTKWPAAVRNHLIGNVALRTSGAASARVVLNLLILYGIPGV